MSKLDSTEVSRPVPVCMTDDHSTHQLLGWACQMLKASVVTCSVNPQEWVPVGCSDYIYFVLRDRFKLLSALHSPYHRLGTLT
jgi:hypothetical protein